MLPWSFLVPLIPTLIAAFAAVASWRAATGSKKASQQIAAIERARRRRELTPIIKVEGQQLPGGMMKLVVKVEGPVDLGRVEELNICVQDDGVDHHLDQASGATQVQVDAQIWGPYRFTPRVDGANDTGRIVGPFLVEIGDSRELQMELTPPPIWSASSGPEWWRKRYSHAGKPIRLRFDCTTGSETWSIPIEVPTTPPPQIF